MAEEEHSVDRCPPYGEEIIDGVCQHPRKDSIICSGCRYKARLEEVTEKVAEDVAKEIPIDEGEFLTDEELEELEQQIAAQEEAERKEAEGPNISLQDIEELEGRLRTLGYSESAIKEITKVYV